MQQRVVIAMAMANDPEVLIADEPTTALDVTVQAQILETLDIAREATASRDGPDHPRPRCGRGHGDRVLVMYAGKPVEIGEVDDIYYHARMPYTKGLLDSLPRLDGGGRGERLRPISGSPPSLVDLPPGCPFVPRCPLHQDRCDTSEPTLRATTSDSHTAACHYSEELAGRQPSEVFGVHQDQGAARSAR